MKKYLVLGITLTILACSVTGCTNLSNPFSYEVTTTDEKLITVKPDSTTATTTAPETGTLQKPIGLNEVATVKYFEEVNDKYYKMEITLTEVIRGQEAYNLIDQISTFLTERPNENEEYILLKFHVSAVDIRNFSGPLSIYAFKILLEDGTYGSPAYSEPGLDELLNMRYYESIDFATPGSTDAYALFIMPKDQAKLVVYEEYPKIYFSLE